MESVVEFATMNQELKDVLCGRDIYVTTGNTVKVTDPSFILLEEFYYENLCWTVIGVPGSTYTKELVDTLIHYGRLMKLLDHYYENSSNLTNEYKISTATEFVFSLRDLLALNPFVVKWKPDLLCRIYQRLLEIASYDLCKNNSDSNFVLSFKRALAVCLAEIGIRHDFYEHGFKFLVRAWTLYHEEIPLSITYSEYLIAKQEFGKAYMVTAEAIERFPNHLNLSYTHGQVCFLLQSTYDCTNITAKTQMDLQLESIHWLTKFLSLVSKEHPKIPEAFYTLGKIYYDMNNQVEENGQNVGIAYLNHYLNLGENGEQSQLACFLPYRSLMKDVLYSIKEEHNETSESISSDSPYQRCICSSHIIPRIDPTMTRNIEEDKHRIELITGLRHSFMQEMARGTTFLNQIFATEKRRVDIAGNAFCPISVLELYTAGSKVWKNRVLTMTVIDEAFSGFGHEDIHLVAEDMSNDTMLIMLHNFDQDKNVQKKFGFGCTLQILQPECTTLDGKHNVVVYDPNAIICGARDNTLCRYCLKTGAEKSCSRCKWANYCDKECQANDWKILKHKKICFPSRPWYIC